MEGVEGEREGSRGRAKEGGEGRRETKKEYKLGA